MVIAERDSFDAVTWKREGPCDAQRENLRLSEVGEQALCSSRLQGPRSCRRSATRWPKCYCSGPILAELIAAVATQPPAPVLQVSARRALPLRVASTGYCSMGNKRHLEADRLSCPALWLRWSTKRQEVKRPLAALSLVISPTRLPQHRIEIGSSAGWAISIASRAHRNAAPA